MKPFHFFFLAALALSVFACDQSNRETSSSQAAYRIDTSQFIAYGKLGLYPVVATQQEQGLEDWKTLGEMMDNTHFRITEYIPFGRSDDASAVGQLTVQNKSRDTVLLIPGDVVTGGNQDRVIAHPVAILPKSMQQISVFCVEPGRWSPRVEEGEPDETQEQGGTFAFSGYFHVASSGVRKAASEKQNQNAVWAEVRKTTTALGAKTKTETYAALQEKGTFKGNIDAYLTSALVKRTADGRTQHPWESTSNIVGVVSVSGDRVTGIDLFGSSELFAKKYSDLLHGYVVDALQTKPETTTPLSRNRIKGIENQINRQPETDKGSFVWNGQLVHRFFVED